jgi:hypothetical protein
MFNKREPDKFESAPGDPEALAPEVPPELLAIERHLAQLAPAPPQIDRDKLMFAAGRAAGESAALAARLRVSGVARWLWPAATATMAAASLLLGMMLVWRNDHPPLAAENSLASSARTNLPPHDIAIASVDSALPPTLNDHAGSWLAGGDGGYLALRQIALTRGVGALNSDSLSSNGRGTTVTEPPPPPATARDLLNELLPEAQLDSRS